MSDDLVKQLQNPRPMSMFLTRADQAKDWTELLHTAADRIEELEAKHQETFQMYVDANEARLDAEAKLSKAIDALQRATDDISGYVGYSYADEYREVLAEMKGQDDD